MLGDLVSYIPVRWPSFCRRTAARSPSSHRERCRRFLDTLTGFVGLFSMDGRVCEVNGAPLEAAGLRREDVIGRPFAETFWWSHSSRAQEQVRRAIRRAAGGEFVREDFDVRIAGGRTIVVDGRFGPLRDEAGRVIRVVGSAVDVTDARRTEDALRASEAQLHHAQRSMALGDLASGVAHDFNNMLATMTGNIELARQELDPRHPAVARLDEALTAAARARDLIAQILSFARRERAVRRPVQLGPLIEEGVALLRVAIPVGVELLVSCAADVPVVAVDPTQVHQVLINLCTNAWQALEGRSGCVAIELRGVVVEEPKASRVGLQPGRYARLSVRDTGKGMSAATLARMFEPFFTTKPLGEGSGLGLAVVRGIMGGHGGAVTVSSRIGQGTSVHAYLPAMHEA